MVAFLNFLLAAIICYVLHPDWMWMYHVDSKSVSMLIVAALVIPLYFTPFVIGFFVSKAIKSKNVWFVILFVIIAAQIAEFIILLDRYNTVTSFADYNAGKRVPLTSTSLAYILTGLSFDVILISLVLFIIGIKMSKRTPKETQPG